MDFTFRHDHVGISVTPGDLEATVDWYATRLGFAEERRFESHGTVFVYLVAGDVKIELMAGASRPGAPVRDVLSSMDPGRLHHCCLAVDDLDAAVAGLRELGVELIGGPMAVEAVGQRLAFIADNLGNVIELAEPGTWRGGR